ncbi:hypothetical protein C8E03_108155 [Lachnotalea glycerini]|uniref:Uncharacterized protein n=1 Tax=Lachnotalea glycerini TaxID=1763509 RepID=A0A318EMB3_9FIRM|nr:hypothetical protein [Lachnotalea glycerini]PXV88428.1 hypothetical protein C8E03_108155 [Lachnotalea glycerini]
MSRKIEDIEKMSLQEVAENYNDVARYTAEALSTWQQIYFIKKQEQINEQAQKINNQMLLYTKTMTILTIVVVIATIASLLIRY